MPLGSGNRQELRKLGTLWEKKREQKGTGRGKEKEGGELEGTGWPRLWKNSQGEQGSVALELVLELDCVEPGWHRTHRDLPASASQMLGLKACATTAQPERYILFVEAIMELSRNLALWKFLGIHKYNLS